MWEPQTGELHGRHEERGRIDRLLAGARAGAGGALMLRGERGIGKSALIAHALRRAGDLDVLHAVAAEPEVDLPFGALHALLGSRIALPAGLPPNQARALRSALAIGPPEDGDRLAAYAGTLGVLAEAAARRPLLVAVDDAQWLDPASASALTFAARRLARAPVAFLFAAGPPATPLDADRLPELVLRRLDAPTARCALEARWPGLAPPVADLVLREAGGSPLALAELPALLSEEQRAGCAPIDAPLAVSGRIARRFLRSVHRLPVTTQVALLVAAAGEGVDRATIERVAGTLGCPPGAVQPAADEALIELEDGAVAFAHPLLRAAVYHDAGRGERRAAHRALAAELEDEPRAWQLAAAADGADERAAAALELAAARGEAGDARGRWRLLERAVELSGDAAARAHRSLAAAQAAQAAGQPARALALAEAALPLAPDPLVRADLRRVQAEAAPSCGMPFPELAVARDARLVVTLDRERAADLLGLALARRFAALDAAGAVSLAEERAALCAGASPAGRLRAAGDLLAARALRGDARWALAHLPELLAEPEHAAEHVESLVWLERHADARLVLALALERALARGAPLAAARCRGRAALLELATGRTAAALVAATVSAEQAERLAADDLLALDLATLARIEAIRGRDQACREHADRAERLGTRLGDERARSGARMALGLLALGAGSFTEAAAVLEPLAGLTERRGIGEPGVLPFEPDLIEAYARLGDRAATSRHLERFARRAHAVERAWALAAAARCAGLLAGERDVQRRFAEALELGAAVASPFERARTELCYGERLRRAGQRRAARAQLSIALEGFAEAGAARWAERARAELRATGQTLGRPGAAAHAQLTPQQQQVACLVAEGHSNRRVAEALFLSRKTVEYHLAHVYRKLDVHSRVELACLFAARAAPPAAAGAVQLPSAAAA